MNIKHAKIILALLIAALTLALCGCSGGDIQPPAETDAPRQPVRTLSCITADALSGMCPAGGENVAVCRADYEAGVTTLWFADMADDAIICEAKLKGTWALKEQTFADGRFALCNRDTNTWKFMSAELMEISSVQTENADGFFSYAADKYYYLSDNVLCVQDIKSGEKGAVPLSPDLRLLYISAFDNKSGLIAAQFFLSPYSSECGTAIIDIAAGRPVMLQKDRYQAYFTPNGIRLMYFDSDAMAYSFLYSGSDGRAMLADSGIFIDAGGDIYSVADSPYVIGIIGGKTTLYSMDNEIKACSLAESGIAGEMYNSCYLYDAGVLVGAAYHGGEFRFYAADVNALEFEYVADAAETASPFTVDESLAQAYWTADAGAGVAESLQQARQYADELEAEYGVRILLSVQCREAAALCDHAITLTDTMGQSEELSAVNAALGALKRSLSLYPEGFFAQFKNGMGEGGVRILLIEQIESNYGAIGCTYENGIWQNIALDVRTGEGMDSIICHEIWHATENHILTKDYSAILPDEWNALNPEGFEYYWDATLVNNAHEWTLYSGNIANVYFVDSYACVDEKEDRARIMEYFMTHDDEAELLIQSPAIRKKLELMCRAIRSTFDTSSWENVRWERLL